MKISNAIKNFFFEIKLDYIKKYFIINKRIFRLDLDLLFKINKNLFLFIIKFPKFTLKLFNDYILNKIGGNLILHNLIIVSKNSVNLLISNQLNRLESKLCKILVKILSISNILMIRKITRSKNKNLDYINIQIANSEFNYGYNSKNRIEKFYIELSDPFLNKFKIGDLLLIHGYFDWFTNKDILNSFFEKYDKIKKIFKVIGIKKLKNTRSDLIGKISIYKKKISKLISCIHVNEWLSSLIMGNYPFISEFKKGLCSFFFGLTNSVKLGMYSKGINICLFFDDEFYFSEFQKSIANDISKITYQTVELKNYSIEGSIFYELKNKISNLLKLKIYKVNESFGFMIIENFNNFNILEKFLIEQISYSNLNILMNEFYATFEIKNISILSFSCNLKIKSYLKEKSEYLINHLFYYMEKPIESEKKKINNNDNLPNKKSFYKNYSFDLLKFFISYVSETITPYLTEFCSEYLYNSYVFLKYNKTSKKNLLKVGIFHLETIIKLSLSNAKSRLSMIVNKNDILNALKIFKEGYMNFFDKV